MKMPASSKRAKKRFKTVKKSGRNFSLSLRDLTDNIVHQLDKGLKDSGFSIKKKQELEEQVLSQLKTVRIQLEGKIRLFEDSSRVGLGKDDTEVWDSGKTILK